MRRQVIDSYTRCINLGAILLRHSLLSRNKLRLRYRVPRARILLFLYTCRKYHAIKNNARAYACEWIFAVVNETLLIRTRFSRDAKASRNVNKNRAMSYILLLRREAQRRRPTLFDFIVPSRSDEY